MSLTKVIASNNAGTTLAISVNVGDTSLTLSAGQGTHFPNPNTGAGEFFSITLIDHVVGLVRNEIVYCTARSGDVCTIIRAQEGTADQAWAVGDIATNLLTAGTLGYLSTTPSPTTGTGNWVRANNATMNSLTVTGSLSSNGSTYLGTNNTQFDTGGHLGILAAPAAWGTASASVQLYPGAGLSIYSAGNSTGAIFGKNLYHDGSVEKFVASGYAQKYVQDSIGNHTFYSSTISGTAGATITWTSPLFSISQAGAISFGGALPISSGGTGLGAVGSVGTFLKSNGSALVYSNLTQNVQPNLTGGSSGSPTLLVTGYNISKISGGTNEYILPTTADDGYLVSLSNKTSPGGGNIIHAPSGGTIDGASSISLATLTAVQMVCTVAPITWESISYGTL